MELLGTGLYPLRQAARLVGADPRTLRRWLQGYDRAQTHHAPLWKTQLKDEGLPEEVIGFKDLLELRMVAAFVRHGVSLRTIRATVEVAARDFGMDYPLTSQQFLTDGRRIFLHALEATDDSEKLIDVLHKQFVFSDIIKPSLYAGIEYGDSGAVRWFPIPKRKSIVLDPTLQFGTPVIADVGIPTDTIHASFLAEGRDKNAVARIFDITPKLVMDAVMFEERPAA